jgi:hypothetical protein
MQTVIRTLGLFSITAVAEIFGCYAFYAIIRMGKPLWLSVPGVAALAVFAWLRLCRLRRCLYCGLAGTVWLELTGPVAAQEIIRELIEVPSNLGRTVSRTMPK